MADRLGIVTRYFQHDMAQAVVQLAETVCNRGTPVTILGREICRREVAKHWDHHVVDERKTSFRRWCKNLNRVIWTRIPPLDEVCYVKNLGIEAVLLPCWEELVSKDKVVVTAMDKVILPYRCVSHALQTHMHLSNKQAIQMPWSPPIPISHSAAFTHKPRVRVHFPLYDTQAKRTDWAIFLVMRRILESADDTELSIACGRQWAMASIRAVKHLRRDYGDRAHLEQRPNLLRRIMTFATSDLTVWPTHFESLGLIGLSSLYMGTPVLAWDIRPHSEYLKSWKNSILVPCDTRENWLGVPEALGDYNEFGEAAVSALRDKALLARMRAATDFGLANRQQQFEAGLDKLLT